MAKKVITWMIHGYIYAHRDTLKLLVSVQARINMYMYLPKSTCTCRPTYRVLKLNQHNGTLQDFYSNLTTPQGKTYSKSMEFEISME